MMIEALNITIIRSNRETTPLVFSNAKVETGMLEVGDYSLKHFENNIAIERMTLAELIASLDTDRSRFIRKVRLLLQYEDRALIIESSLSELNSCNWRYEIKPRSVVRSLLRLSAGGLHVAWAENQKVSAKIVEKLLCQFLGEKAGEVERVRSFISLNLGRRTVTCGRIYALFFYL